MQLAESTKLRMPGIEPRADDVSAAREDRTMAFANKTLWVVGYNSLTKFVQVAQSVGASAVAIRTDNNLAAAIDRFHEAGIAVIGWRWPSAQRARAMVEADRARRFFDSGMDGYFVDPEGAPGQHYDWDQDGLESVAEDFCNAVVTAAAGRPFGVTSHFRGKVQHPKLPWAQFFAQADVLLPQSYWRTSAGTVAGGDPAANYRTGISAWTATGASAQLIVPMAGELTSSTGQDLVAYADEANQSNVADGHFYAYEEANVPDEVWAELAAL